MERSGVSATPRAPTGPAVVVAASVVEAWPLSDTGNSRKNT